MSDSSKALKVLFAEHQLPRNDAIKHRLVVFGVDTVEDLELYKPPDVAQLFHEQKKTIVKCKAKLAWEKLGGQENVEF